MAYRLLVALLLVSGWPLAGWADGAHWYRDPTCTGAPVSNTANKTVTLIGYGKGDTYYWCPTDGVDSPDLVNIGYSFAATWRGSISSPPGTVILNVYTGCVGASPPDTNCTDLFQGSSATYQQMDPATPPSCSGLFGPGRYRWHPSAACSDCSLEVRGN